MLGNISRARLKKEQDVESAILVLAIELSDGSLGNIISRGHRNVSEVYVYHCNLCRVVDMVGEKTLMYHIAGDVHQTKLRSVEVINVVKRLFLQEEAELQKTIDESEECYVGLEYVIELRQPPNIPSYICVLCDKRCDKQYMLLHLICGDHRYTFLRQQYPRLLGTMMKRPGIIDAKLRSLITAVCFNLNRARRRFTVLVMDLDDFLTNKQEIFNEIHRGAEVYPNIKFGDLVEDYSDSSDSDLEILDPKPVGNQNTAITLEHRFSAGGSRERSRAEVQESMSEMTQTTSSTVESFPGHRMLPPSETTPTFQYPVPPPMSMIPEPYPLQRYPNYSIDGPRTSLPVYPDLSNIISSNSEDPVTLLSVCKSLICSQVTLNGLESHVLVLHDKASMLENDRPYSSDESLMNDFNCMFFESVNQKLIDLVYPKNVHPCRSEIIKDLIVKILKLLQNSFAMQEVRLQSYAERINHPLASPIPQTSINGVDYDGGMLARQVNIALIKNGNQEITRMGLDDYIKKAKLAQKRTEAETIDLLVNCPEEDQRTPYHTLQLRQCIHRSLADDEIKSVLMNFRTLPAAQQLNLINCMKIGAHEVHKHQLTVASGERQRRAFMQFHNNDGLVVEEPALIVVEEPGPIDDVPNHPVFEVSDDDEEDEDLIEGHVKPNEQEDFFVDSDEESDDDDMEAEEDADSASEDDPPEESDDDPPEESDDECTKVYGEDFDFAKEMEAKLIKDFEEKKCRALEANIISEINARDKIPLAFNNNPGTSSSTAGSYKLHLSMEDAESSKYPYENLEPTLRCKKPRFGEPKSTTASLEVGSDKKRNKKR